MPGLLQEHSSLAAAPCPRIVAGRAAAVQTCPSLRQPDFDAAVLAAEVIDVILDVLVDFAGRLDEGFLDILRRLRGRLPENQVVVPGEIGAFFEGDLAALEVGLVTDEHDGHVRVCVLPRLLKPAREVIEGVTAGDVVHQERSTGSAVVRARNGAERLLTCSVPDLELDLFVLNRDEARPKLHTNRKVMVGAEALIGELQKQAGLANTCVTNDDVLEEVSVRHGNCNAPFRTIAVSKPAL
eukprot:CAMPEP_0115496358 /NCGR_PEP_ID=MMETSP0271-20121206/65727_1 /TAXON_ID=71861 /ORGANISM="Scrippsiella trochoidea, Strain CCMP3099" /LENGTH=239 /DNA_ID=CAMNT_0002925031 /DNA_START=406 /DNA_END=1122 /DNA_ORIENTATION=+